MRMLSPIDQHTREHQSICAVYRLDYSDVLDTRKDGMILSGPEHLHSDDK